MSVGPPPPAPPATDYTDRFRIVKRRRNGLVLGAGSC